MTAPGGARIRRRSLAAALAIGMAASLAGDAVADPAAWKAAWPETDFSRHSVAFSEIFSGGPPKDGIPSIDDPEFAPTARIDGIGDTEPVIAFSIGDDLRAYPLRILIWHEIVNDRVSGVPVAVTYCPLCNSAIVFDRRVDGSELDFGTTGKLRNSDLIMYDRQTESWWQQFTGAGIVGAMTGKTLTMLPARVESFATFRERGGGKVLVPTNPNLRPYGMNPYAGYDRAPRPFLYRGGYPEGIEPMAYVVAVGKDAWPLDLLRKAGTIEAGDLRLTWRPGQNSALDSAEIAKGRDIGNVAAQRRAGGRWVDAVHDLTFAFVFHAFAPDGTIHRR